MGILTFIIRKRLLRQTNLFRHGAVVLCAIFLLCFPVSGHVETTPGEYSLKAAFLYNFAKFVEWPDNTFNVKDEFCVATLGRGPLDRELAALAGRKIQGRNMAIRKIDFPEEAANCQILFISRSELPRLESILDSLRGAPVLTVADRDDFCRMGGMLSLVIENGKISFDVNIRETQVAKLKPNSQLLRLARKIYGRQ